MSRQIVDVQTFFAQVAAGLFWIGSKLWKYAGPCYRFFYKWIFSEYVYLWNKAVYVDNSYAGKDFSKVRAGLFILSTLFFIFVFIPIFGDTALYLATVKRDEEIILLSSQEVDTHHNVHNIEGCYHLPCSDSDALYFRVTNSWFNNLWSLVHLKGLFYPEMIAAPVASGYNRCIITAYGIRATLIVHNTNWFPSVLEIKSCIPAIKS